MQPSINLILIIASCIAFYIVFFAYRIYRSIKLAKKLIATTTHYEQHPPNPEMHILVAGDSIAVGVGATENINSIAGRLGAQFPKADIKNTGKSGAKLKDLLSVLKKQKGNNYNFIILQIGANDITHFTPYDNIRNELSEVLSLANELSSKIILLTGGDIGRARVFHWPLSTIYTSRTLKVRDIFIEETSKYINISYIDLYVNRHEDTFERNFKKYYASDSFHLTDDGYGEWYFFIKKNF